MVSVCTGLLGGGRSCEHFGGYKAISGIPLPLPLLSIACHITLSHIPLQGFDYSFKTIPFNAEASFDHSTITQILENHLNPFMLVLLDISC